LLAPGVAAAAPVVVRLAPDVVVHGDDVALTDIADIQGSGPVAERLRALRLLPAPPAGVTQPITADFVRLRTGASGDGAHIQVTGAERTLVTRGFQIVRGTDLIEAVQREVRTRLTAGDTRGEPSTLKPIARPEDVRLPTGDVRFDVRLHESAANAPTLAANVSVRVNGR